jgi:hypothetical protein
VYNFVFSTVSTQALGNTNSLGAGGSFPGGKVAGAEANLSRTSAVFKKMWVSTSTPPIHLHGVVLN